MKKVKKSIFCITIANSPICVVKKSIKPKFECHFR